MERSGVTQSRGVKFFRIYFFNLIKNLNSSYILTFLIWKAITYVFVTHERSNYLIKKNFCRIYWAYDLGVHNNSTPMPNKTVKITYNSYYQKMTAAVKN